MQAQAEDCSDSSTDPTAANIPAERIAVRQHQIVPTVGSVQIDPGLAPGRMIFEFYGSRLEGTTCRGMELIGLFEPQRPEMLLRFQRSCAALA